ncbi:MAG TPA: hypothetical protein DHI91_00140 [Candidatus Portnoybacteria bacterium]|nr:hypothetical protein [Candidatus Portnoybacteria bacterium]
MSSPRLPKPIMISWDIFNANLKYNLSIIPSNQLWLSAGRSDDMPAGASSLLAKIKINLLHVICFVFHE